MESNQTYKLLHSKGNNKQNEKETYRLGEYICKWCNQQGLNFQHIQTAHTTQKQTQSKSGQDLNRHSFKEGRQMANRCVKRCSALEKCKSKLQWGTTSQQFRMAVIKKSTNNKCWRECGEKAAPPTLLVGI